MNEIRQRYKYDYATAASISKTGSDIVRAFVADAYWAHNDRESLAVTIQNLRQELQQRDAEIELLKRSLLEVEEKPDRDVLVVNLMRHTTITKNQARALIDHWLDGVEPNPELFKKNESPVSVCDIPPPGWYCTRKPGHDGPCAAIELCDLTNKKSTE